MNFRQQRTPLRDQRVLAREVLCRHTLLLAACRRENAMANP